MTDFEEAEPAIPAWTKRIACIGDSITYGYALDDRESTAYPAVLGRLLGPGYFVQNFGFSGATVLRSGSAPLYRPVRMRRFGKFAPAWIVLALGANDSRATNWQNAVQFADDLRFLIDELRVLPGHEHIWLCAPAPAFENHWGIVPDVLAQEIVPLVRRLARELGISLIDLWEPLVNRSDLFPDHVHPGPEACAIIAQCVYAALKNP